MNDRGQQPLVLRSPDGEAGSGGQGDTSPEGAGSQQLPREALDQVNAAITARLREAGLPDLKTGLDSVQQSLQQLADQRNAGAEAEPEGKRGGKAATTIDARLEQLEHENKQLRELNERGQQSMQGMQKRQALAAALVNAGVPAGSVQLTDSLTALAGRKDITAAGTTPEGTQLWQGTVNSELGTRPNASLTEVVGEFIRSRPHLLPPAHTGGTGSGEGVVVPGASGPQQVALGELTTDQVAALSQDQLDKLWAEGGGKPFGEAAGMYPSVGK